MRDGTLVNRQIQIDSFSWLHNESRVENEDMQVQCDQDACSQDRRMREHRILKHGPASYGSIPQATH